MYKERYKVVHGYGERLTVIYMQEKVIYKISCMHKPPHLIAIIAKNPAFVGYNRLAMVDMYRCWWPFIVKN